MGVILYRKRTFYAKYEGGINESGDVEIVVKK